MTQLAQLTCLAALSTAVLVKAAFVDYDFSRSNCLDGVIEDGAGGESFGDLVVNMSSARCLNGVGVEGNAESPGWPIATSIGTSSALIEALQTPAAFPGLSFELWVSLGEITCLEYSSNFCQVVLLSLGSTSTTQSTDLCGRINDIEILYNARDQTLSLRFNDGNNGCFEYACAHYIEPSEYPFHMVLTIAELVKSGRYYSAFKWFINGTRVDYTLDQNMLPTDMVSEWSNDYKLQLLDLIRWPDSYLYWPFEGKLFGASMHVTVLSSVEILALFSAGILNSVPTVSDATAEIAEDGEMGNHYENPLYYLEVVPANELQEIHLGVYDADDDPTNPNYAQQLPVPRVFVASLPLIGTLFNSSGQSITAVPFEVFRLLGSYTVRYRPLHNEASTGGSGYAGFSFYARDGTSSIRSIENGTVTIHVSSKNDPPVAINSNHTVYAGTKANIIPLAGTDVDIGDHIRGAFIVVSPARGNLYQVFDDGSASNVIVTEGEALWRRDVAYRFDTLELDSNKPDQQTVGNDSFSFAVYDSDSNHSATAIVNATVSPGVWALPTDGMWPCYEDTGCEVYIYGSAAADIAANLSFTISSVPAHGQLFDAGTNTPVGIGSRLSTTDAYPYSGGLDVIYKPVDNFFTTPETTWNGTQIPGHASNDTVSFYVSIELGAATMSSTSVDQLLQVNNVNDNSTISCPTELYHVQAIGENFDDFHSSIDRPDQAIFSNITITETDRSVDAIRVDVTTERGMVSVNNKYKARLNFRSDCDELRNVRCNGDGDRDQRATFIGQPEDVENALNGMVYESYYPNIVDNVTITIYDGAWGKCLGYFRTLSVRTSCARSTCSFLVEVGGRYVSGDESSQALKIHWSLVLVFIMLVGACIMKVLCLGFARVKTVLREIVKVQRRPRHPRSGVSNSRTTFNAGLESPAAICSHMPEIHAVRRARAKSGALRRCLSRLRRRRVVIARDSRQGPVAQVALVRSSPRTPSPKPSWDDN